MSRILSSWIVALLPALAGRAQDPVPPRDRPEPLARFHVKNAWPHARRELIRASIPFAAGLCQDPLDWSVRGHPTAWRVLTRWPDGSAQWAQAQFIETLPSLQTVELAVVRERNEIHRDFAPGPRIQRILSEGVLQTEVEDPFGVRYRATLRLDPGAGGALISTPLCRTYRFREYHRAVSEEKPGIGRDYLTLTAYLTLFHGFEHAELLLILGNDYQGSDEPGNDDPNLRPLGSVWLRRFSLLVDTDELAFIPRWIRENGLRPPVRIQDETGEPTRWQQDLLGPGPGIYLADASTKAFPILLYAPSGERGKPGEDEDERLRRQTASAMAVTPLYPMPRPEDVRESRAMNAHGGPAPWSPDVTRRAIQRYRTFRDAQHFGPFGGWGDIGATATTGTPRNTPIGLHLAVRASSPELMLEAEGFCLQQALRPYHLWGLRIGPERDIYIEGLPKWIGYWVSADTLGRSKLSKVTEQYRKGLKLPFEGPYGMGPFDYEHFTVDVLYDFYCLTGSPFAREELRMLGEQLKGMLRRSKYHWHDHGTTRGEGWCMKAFVLCFQATGDESLKEHAIHRLHNMIDRFRGKPPNGYAFRQGPHPNAFGPGVSWDAPWQQGAYVMGMEAAFRYFGDPTFRTVAIDVAEYMAGPGWLEGVGPKYFVSTDDPARYKLPEGYAPLGGSAEFQVSAFVLAAELADEVGKKKEAALFRSRADTIMNAHRQSGWDALCANKWFQIYLDRRTNK